VAYIIGSCYSDQSGTLKVQFSPDGTNWDVEEEISYTGGTKMGFSVEVVCPYCRIVYTNGATDQTVFRLYTFGRVI